MTVYCFTVMGVHICTHAQCKSVNGRILRNILYTTRTMQSPNQQHYAQGMGGMAPTYSNSSPSMGMGSPMMPQHMGISGGMAPGMVPQQMGMTGAGHHTAHHHVHHHVPSVIPTKHVIMPVKVSSHHVNNTTDVHYDIEITISEYFPDGSKAEHKHRLSQSFTDLKKIHDAVGNFAFLPHSLGSSRRISQRLFEVTFPKFSYLWTQRERQESCRENVRIKGVFGHRLSITKSPHRQNLPRCFEVWSWFRVTFEAHCR